MKYVVKEDIRFVEHKYTLKATTVVGINYVQIKVDDYKISVFVEKGKFGRGINILVPLKVFEMFIKPIG